jgi:erythronate-4-phosphate dehydrogenase
MIIAIDKALPYWSEAFSDIGELLPFSSESMKPKEISNADILVVRTVTKVDESLLRGSSIRFVAAASAGIDHIDQEYLRAQDIGFCYAAGCNATAVSEYIVTALHVIAARRNWDLSKKSIAVIGVGHVGSLVAKKTQALGMNVLLSDPPLRDLTGDEKYRDFEDVLGADILSFHVPLVSGVYPTWHMIDKGAMNRISPEQYIINTSRGAVIDNYELKSALHESRIEGAVLDVWEGEPQIDFSLLDLVDIGTPHIAGIALDGKIRATEMVRAELCRFFNVQSTWNAESLYPKSKRIRRSESDGNSVLPALLQAFDILKADTSLRGIKSAAEFSRLRDKFPLRPEFRHFKIELGERHGRFAHKYEGLGFEVVVR